MSIPEIIHRCSACGASLKTALFCPQCGKAATPAVTVPAPVAGNEVNEDAKNEGTESEDDKKEQSPTAVALAADVSPAPKSNSVGERPAASAGREMIERRLKPRVEKLRHASSAVLDEASYDPSVRFILVVVVLFVVFVVLMLLNKWIG